MSGSAMGDTTWERLLALAAADVAAAERCGDATIAGLPLTPALRASLHDALEDATGTRAWQLEHLRDRRPLAEVLEVARMIRAQRRLVAA